MYKFSVKGGIVVVADHDLGWALASLRLAGVIGATVTAKRYDFGYLPGCVYPQLGEVGFSPYSGKFYAAEDLSPGGFTPKLVEGYTLKSFGTNYTFIPVGDYPYEEKVVTVNDFDLKDLRDQAAATVIDALQEAEKKHMPTLEERLAMCFKPTTSACASPNWAAGDKVAVSWQLALPVIEVVASIDTEKVTFENGKRIFFLGARYEAFTRSIRTNDWTFATCSPHGTYGSGGLEVPLLSYLRDQGGWQKIEALPEGEAILVRGTSLDIVAVKKGSHDTYDLIGEGMKGWRRGPFARRGNVFEIEKYEFLIYVTEK